MKLEAAFSVLIWSLLCSGCIVTDVGNPADEPEGEQEIVLTPLQLEEASSNLTQGGKIDSLYVHLRSASFLSGESCDERMEVALPAQKIDLTKGVFSANFSVARRHFCALELEFGPTEDFGKTYLISGTHRDGSKFAVSDDRVINIRLQVEAPSTISLDKGPVFVGLLLNRWLSMPLPEQVGDVSPLTTPDFAQRLFDDLAPAVVLFDDRDGDGEIAGSEQENIVSIGQVVLADHASQPGQDGRGSASERGAPVTTP